MKAVELIFLSARYKKLADFAYGLSEGKTRTNFRRAFRDALFAKAKEKVFETGQKESRAGAYRTLALLQSFTFDNMFSRETELEKIIPENTNRLLILYIFDVSHKYRDSFQSEGELERAIADKFRELSQKQDAEANLSLANNFHEIVLIVRQILDEL
jgi:hypothetical protein